MTEYCVMKDGNNVECLYNEYEALGFANGYGADKILKVQYAEDGETEISCECIWER